MDKLKYVKLKQDDGTYTDKIPLSVDGNYIDINNDTLTHAFNAVQAQTLNNTEAIKSLANGSPKGVYATTADLVNANPVTGVYIVSANGHIYSWTHNGSTTVDLGVYQATALEEQDNIALQKINEYKEYDIDTLNLFQTYWMKGYNLNTDTGEIYKDTDTRMAIKDFIPVNYNQRYALKFKNMPFPNGKITIIYGCYDSTYNYLGSRADSMTFSSTGEIEWKKINTQTSNVKFYENTAFLKLCFRTGQIGIVPDSYINLQTFFYSYELGDASLVTLEPSQYINMNAIDYKWYTIPAIKDKIDSMMITTNNKLIGVVAKNWYFMADKDRIVYSPDLYPYNALTLELSPIKANTNYKILNSQGAGGGYAKSIIFYDENKHYISHTGVAYNVWALSPATAKYARISFLGTDQSVSLDILCKQPIMLIEENDDETENPGYKIDTKYINYDFDNIPTSGVTEERVKELIKDEDKISEVAIIDGFKKVIGHNRNDRYFNFGFFTDTHSNLQNSTHSISYMHKIANNELVDMSFHGGDIISTYDPIDSVDKYVEAMLPNLNDYKSIKNLFFVKGNHDEGHVDGVENNLSKYQYNALFSPCYKDNEIQIHYNNNDDYGNYYYIDLQKFKIRIIVIDSFYTPGSNSTDYGAAQLEWVATEALDDTDLTNEWSILVFSHTIGKTDNMGKLFKAYNTRSSTQGYDFANAKCKFIGTVLGHEHNDNYASDGGFNRIGVTCAFGTTPAVDIFTIDTDNNIIYETRIGGRGTDRAYYFGNNIGPVEIESV